jgi:hypothetical protein
MKATSILPAIGIALSAFLFSCGDSHDHQNASGKYICPCGGCPEVKLDKGGDCPKCGMELVFRTDEEIAEDSAANAASGEAAPADKTSTAGTVYACPMKCTEEKFDHPAKCSVCGMDMEKTEQ